MPLGTLEVITGPMYAGKSTELIRRLTRSKIAKQQVVAFRPQIDTRGPLGKIHTHAHAEIEAFMFSSVDEVVLNIEPSVEVVGFDEIQFADESILDLIAQMINAGVRVIVCGLDLDFLGRPFGIMPRLLALADKVDKMTAICAVCSSDNANRTQRMINDMPASETSPLVLIGDSDCYMAVCKDCHKIGSD